MFGSNPLLWCWPLQGPGSDGLLFPVAEGSRWSIVFDFLTHLNHRIVINEQYSWPPKDPYEDPLHGRIPTGDPWTYGNGDVNPNLSVSNTRMRKSHVPPYHSSYDEEAIEGGTSTSSSPERDSHSSNEYLPLDQTRRREGWRDEDDGREGISGMRVRRGSEGWEATMPNRWTQLQAELDRSEPWMDNQPIERGRALRRD